MSQCDMQLLNVEMSCPGHLEQSLVDSLRTYAPAYEDDADGGQQGEPAALRDPAAMALQGATERHAALTEQAQRLLHQGGPSATDIRMYNMMLTRESTVQVDILPYLCLLLTLPTRLLLWWQLRLWILWGQATTVS